MQAKWICYQSARYVAIMKSCSTIKADLFVFKIYLLMTLAAIILYSESKYAEGSSIK